MTTQSILGKQVGADSDPTRPIDEDVVVTGF
ncbi:MAG: hypothetical protein JWR06_3016, partial [Jatrophihabitans sp.]|nr:hypothetical protein [Jatrophihabitans sp.]